MSMKRTNVHFTEYQLKKLSELSARSGAPVAELIRRAVNDLLRKEASRGKRTSK
jgi:Arc/MetJ-type ribon-helix-helix transcriptional regulator